MILSQITRSDVRFELLLSTSGGGNLSPVGSVAQTVVSSVSSVSQTVAVVGPDTIAVVAVVGLEICGVRERPWQCVLNIILTSASAAGSAAAVGSASADLQMASCIIMIKVEMINTKIRLIE